MKKKAVILLSGGLDSAVALFYAREKGYDCQSLFFDYGQRHAREEASAEAIAKSAKSTITTVKLDLPWKGSSLLDKGKRIPLNRTIAEIEKGIPSTYVPARNTIFLSVAASFAETIGAHDIFIGAHFEDSSGYPDCRKNYLEAFGKAIKLGTKAGLENGLKVRYPLIEMPKKDIIKLGARLKVPFQLTWSCYNGGAKACMKCDSCILRAKGFSEAGIKDPAIDMETPQAEITEIFSSIQGEGVLVGAKQIFVRFKNCNLDCSFCDERSKSSSSRRYSPLELIREVKELEASKGPHHSVSLTGGEPLLYAEFLKVFLKYLKANRMKSYLETNGTLPYELSKVIDLVDVISMDIKLPSSTGQNAFWNEHLKFLRIASRKRVFVKVIVTTNTVKKDVEKAIMLLKKVKRNIPFILQPATPVGPADRYVESKTLLKFLEVMSIHKINNVRIVPQIHKILNMK